MKKAESMQDGHCILQKTRVWLLVHGAPAEYQRPEGQLQWGDITNCLHRYVRLDCIGRALGPHTTGIAVQERNSTAAPKLASARAWCYFPTSGRRAAACRPMNCYVIMLAAVKYCSL